MTLQFDTDYDATDNTTAFQGRAVFEPSRSDQAAVTNETWQTWNPLTAPSGWWQTGNASVGGVASRKTCTQASPCSFAQLLATTRTPDPADHGQNTGQPIARRHLAESRRRWHPASPATSTH